MRAVKIETMLTHCIHCGAVFMGECLKFKRTTNESANSYSSMYTCYEHRYWDCPVCNEENDDCDEYDE